MNSIKPYILKAYYDWIIASDRTPYLVVDASFQSLRAPRDFVEQNRIVFNISPLAAHDLSIDYMKGSLSFQARFKGVVQFIYVPIAAILAIYAREDGRGMIFDAEEETTTSISLHWSNENPPEKTNHTSETSKTKKTFSSSNSQIKN